jgi:hypothetical protein
MGRSLQILPCGWPYNDVIDTEIQLVLTGQHFAWPEDIMKLVYRTYCFTSSYMYGTEPGWPETVHAIKDPQPIEPSKGCCFRIAGIVVKVKGTVVKVFCKKESCNDLKGWEKRVALHLAEDVNKPEPGGMYVIKALLEPFAKGCK